MAKSKSAAKSEPSLKPKKKKGKPRGRPFPPGVSGNPAGAPKRGESWAEVVKRIGAMTPAALADYAKGISARLKSYGDAITMKELAVAAAYTAFIFDPVPGMFNALADRAEGKPIQPIMMNWRAELERDGKSASDIFEAMVVAAMEQLRRDAE